MKSATGQWANRCVAVGAVFAAIFVSNAAFAEKPWGVEVPGQTLALPSDWGHQHPPLKAGLTALRPPSEPSNTALLDPEGLIRETPSLASGAAAQGRTGAPLAAGAATVVVSQSGAARTVARPAGRAVVALAPIALRQEPTPSAPEQSPAGQPAPSQAGRTQSAPSDAPATPTVSAPTAPAAPAAAPVPPGATTPSVVPAASPPAATPISAAAAQVVEPPPPAAISAPVTQAAAPPAATLPAAQTVERPDGGPRREAYVLGPLDRIKLIVFQEPDLSGEFVIQASGRVSLPLLSEVQAQGLTPRELEAAITAEFVNRRLLNDPKVAVEVMSARPFFILGEVQKPGEYPYAAGLSALNAIATAGGFTPLADQGAISIKRAGGVAWETLPLDGGVQIGPGDTVRVEKGAFYILGEVQKAGAYPYSPGMSVLRAVATAEGWTPRAERSRVMIMRRGETQQREVPLRPDAPINPGDTIIILERWF